MRKLMPRSLIVFPGKFLLTFSTLVSIKNLFALSRLHAPTTTPRIQKDFPGVGPTRYADKVFSPEFPRVKEFNPHHFGLKCLRNIKNRCTYAGWPPTSCRIRCMVGIRSKSKSSCSLQNASSLWCGGWREVLVAVNPSFSHGIRALLPRVSLKRPNCS